MSKIAVMASDRQAAHRVGVGDAAKSLVDEPPATAVDRMAQPASVSMVLWARAQDW